MKNMLLVFLGGGIGSALRYLVSTFFVLSANAFPMATFMVNIIGSLLIGILMAIFLDHSGVQENWKLLLITGFCGGFTTFSAFSKESFMMIQNQQWPTLALYILLSILVCIGATALGFYLAK